MIPHVTHAGAFAILKGAIAMAAELQAPASIAVVDSDGSLLAFLRLDGAPASSGPAAIEKAAAAVAAAAGLRGGVPVVVNGRTVGGVGVVTGGAEHDVVLAQAGIACLQTGGLRASVQ